MNVSECMNRYGIPLCRAIPPHPFLCDNVVRQSRGVPEFELLAGGIDSCGKILFISPPGQTVSGLSPAQLFVLRLMAGRNAASLYMSTRGQAEQLRRAFHSIWQPLFPYVDFHTVGIPASRLERLSRFVDISGWSTLDVMLFVREIMAEFAHKHICSGMMVLDSELDVACDDELGLWRTPQSRDLWRCHLHHNDVLGSMPLVVINHEESEDYLCDDFCLRTLVTAECPTGQSGGITDIVVDVQRNENGRTGTIYAQWDQHAHVMHTAVDFDDYYTEGCPDEDDDPPATESIPLSAYSAC